MREMPKNLVGDVKKPFAKRQLRADRVDFQIFSILAALSLLLAFAKPFGTASLLNWPEALVYWGLIIFYGYGLGRAASGFVGGFLSEPEGAFLSYPQILRGTLIGVGISLWVAVQNWIWFRFSPPVQELWAFYGRIIFIAWLIDWVISRIVASRKAQHSIEGSPQDAAQTIPILDRLPPQKRGKLLALSAEDHYVRVVTDVAQSMVLMRLRDAINEVGPVDGIHIHRSHWVACEAIAHVVRKSDRADVILKNGMQFPASRARLADLKARGFVA